MASHLDLPRTYVLSTHLPEQERLRIEETIPDLTYDVGEARLVLGKVATRQRAEFELRRRGCWTVEVGGEGKEEKAGERKKAGKGEKAGKDDVRGSAGEEASEDLPRKKRKIGGIGGRRGSAGKDKAKAKAAGKGKEKEVITIESSTESRSETESEAEAEQRREKGGRRRRSSTRSQNRSSPPPEVKSPAEPVKIDWGDEDTIKVVKLAWYEQCVAAGHLLPLDGFLVYEGRRISRPEGKKPAAKPPKHPSSPAIMSRAREDAPPTATPFSQSHHAPHQPSSQQSVTHPTPLARQSTSEEAAASTLPPIPAYLHTPYSCQRPTPLHTPNDAFLALLKKIRHARMLTGDEVGVRAYSTAIATLAAYPHALTCAPEITRLPGCSDKIAALWSEFHNTGHVGAVDEIEADEELRTLDLFFDIWGVGPKGARDFYYRKGWRDLDDVVEFGWKSLTRVQQIGVKFHDELLRKIPRKEVERIGAVILDAARRVAPGAQMVIVGGYRRGKEESGDVDVVVSHPDEAQTHHLVTRIVQELERGGWITHTLLLSTPNSEREQTPVAWKGNEPHGVAPAGFDTLDKALVVWQDPEWEGKTEDPEARNPNLHRRVDIIVSPWKTVGCAVAGWTADMTFQRDMRRYARHVKGLKFDSSGVRSREDGHWVDLEGVGGKAPDMVTAEKRVFEGMGLEWREPWERCTG